MRSRPMLRRVLGAVALLTALAIGTVLGQRLGRDEQPAADPMAGAAPAVTVPQDPSLPDLVPLGEGPAAAAREAIEDFLSAEAADDFDASFDVLTPADAESFGPAAQWRQQHADFPGIARAEVVEVGRPEGADPSSAVAVVDLQLESVLNEFVGLVPARATGLYALQEVDGRWGVAFSDSSIVPRYPDEDEVEGGAREFVRAAVACEVPDGPYTGRIYGPDNVRDDLCGAEGTILLSAVGPVGDDSDTTALISAFGPEVLRWGREVSLEQPAEARLVLAPLADQWVVIGVLPAR